MEFHPTILPFITFLPNDVDRLQLIEVKVTVNRLKHSAEGKVVVNNKFIISKTKAVFVTFDSQSLFLLLQGERSHVC
jgi:hypothetical protein